MRHSILGASTLAAALLLTSGCGSSQRIGDNAGGDDPVTGTPTYDAQIKRGSFGVPHITGEDYGDIGYGYGYVHAEDNLCVLAEDLITIQGERARYFGRDGTYTLQANGNTSNNVESDFFWRHVATAERVAALAADASPEAAAATAGF